MEIKNKKSKISDHVRISEPLQASSSENDKLDVYVNDLRLFDIVYFESLSNFIEFKFKTPVNIETPSSLKRSGRLSTIFSHAPLMDNKIEDLRKIILRSKKGFLLIKFDYDNDLNVRYEHSKDHIIRINFPNSRDFFINVSYHKNINEILKISSLIQDQMPLWVYGLGLFYDLNKKQDINIYFSDIVKKYGDSTFVILNNWDNLGFIKFDSKVESIIHKMMLNKIKYILNFDNSVPITESKNLAVFKKRNGEFFMNHNKVYIDYFNDDGKRLLANTINEIFKNKANGIYFNPLLPSFDDEETYQKTICKSGREIIPYNKNVQLGLKKFNNILNGINTKSAFFSDILSPLLQNSIYIKEIKNEFEDAILVINDLFKQGYSNFGVLVKDKKNNLFSKKGVLISILLLCCPIVVFEIENILGSIYNEYSNYFINTLLMRAKLRVYFENVLLTFKREGLVPLSIVEENGKLNGFYFGKDLYCAMLKEKYFDLTFYLPDGLWFNIEEKTIIEGGGYYIHRGKKDIKSLFIRESSMILMEGEDQYKTGLLSKEINIYIFPKISRENKLSKKIIFERYVQKDEDKSIAHYIEYKNIDKKTVVIYRCSDKNNLKRKIIFNLIVNKSNVSKIMSNKKRIILKEQKDSDLIKFSFFNNENKYSFNILYKQ